MINHGLKLTPSAGKQLCKAIVFGNQNEEQNKKSILPNVCEFQHFECDRQTIPVSTISRNLIYSGGQIILLG